MKMVPRRPSIVLYGKKETVEQMNAIIKFYSTDIHILLMLYMQEKVLEKSC